MIDHYSKNSSEHQVDVLIIGSGAGGATVGNELVQAGFGVLIVEEGMSVPATEVPSDLSKSFLKMWRMGGMTLAYGTSSVSYAEGCCVGGGTEINSAIFQQAPEELLNYWSVKYSINNFSTKSLELLYQKAAISVNASLTTGEVGAHSEILKRAGETQNWAVKSLERGQKNCVGTNHCAIGCPTGAKQSMSTSVLKDFNQHGGQLISKCHIKKITRSNNKVTGALATLSMDDGTVQNLVIHAKHVFVCGGAIQTPFLLLKSGFKKGVGHCFKLHPTIRVLAEFNTEVNAIHSRLPLYAVTEFLPDYRLGGSVFSLPTYGMFLAEDWINRGHMLPSYKNMGMYYAMAKGTGAGRVRNFPLLKHPLVQYQLSEEDWQNIEAGLYNLSKSLFEYGARKIQPSIVGMPAWTSVDMMRSSIFNDFPRKNCNLMSIHLFSSVRMGENTAFSAADSYGKIHGVDNLYVADASLIPESPGVNPQATVMALALRVAHRFIENV